MTKIYITIILIFWIIFTFLLAISLVGIIVLIREDYNCKHYQTNGDANWFKIGIKLINKLIE